MLYTGTIETVTKHRKSNVECTWEEITSSDTEKKKEGQVITENVIDMRDK